MVWHDYDVDARQVSEQLALAVLFDVAGQQQATAAGADEQHAGTVVVTGAGAARAVQPFELDSLP